MKRIDTCTHTDLLVGLLLAGIVSVLLAYRIFAYLCEVPALDDPSGPPLRRPGHRRLSGSPSGLEAPAIPAGPPGGVSSTEALIKNKELPSAHTGGGFLVYKKPRRVCRPQAAKK